MTETAETSPAGGALEKGLALFGRIVADRGRTKLAVLAADMKLPRSTLHRLAATLEAQGLIARLAPGHYDIGMRLAARMENVSPRAQLATLSRPLLRQLARTCNATAHLGVLENDMVTYLVKETGRVTAEAIPFTLENTQLEAYCSGIGKVLLAWLPAGGRARYLAGGPFVALTSQTITDPGQLAEHLKLVRLRRFACDEGEVADNLRCLAVPLLTDPSTMMAAISLSFFGRRDSDQDDAGYLATLSACADKLRHRLNNHPTSGRRPPAPK